MIFDGWKTLTLHLKTCFTQLKCYEKYFFKLALLFLPKPGTGKEQGVLSQREVLSRGNDLPYSSPLGLYLQVCLCSVLDGKQGRKKRRGEEKWSSVVQAFKHTVSFAAAKAFMR